VATGNPADPIVKTILFDGENQKLMATNFSVYAEVHLPIFGASKTVIKPKQSVARISRDDLEDLTVAQMKDLVADYFTKEQAEALPAKPKREDLLSVISLVFEASVDKEISEAADEWITVHERFCVEPKLFLKMVESMDEKPDDMIDLKMEACERPGSFGYLLSLGASFKTMPIENPDYFPENDKGHGDVLVTRLPGNKLAKIANVPPQEANDTRSHIVNMFFDPIGKKIVSTDGSRLHTLDNDLNTEKNLFFDKRAMSAICKTAGDDDVVVKTTSACSMIEVFVPSANLTVYAINDPGAAFPEYSELFSGYNRSVVIDFASLSKTVGQANVLADADFKAICMGFNGGLDVSFFNPNTAEFEKENIAVSGDEVEPKYVTHMNGKFVADAINGIGDKIIIKLKDVDNKTDENGTLEGCYPLIFTSESFGAYSAAVMPMRV